jgi:hypothetical protein
VERYKNIIAIIAGSLISCAMAVYNGYPFVYPDTGSYIYSGFSDVFLPDRPPFYGYFLRHMSLAESLWLVIAAQSLLINYLLYRLVMHTCRTGSPAGRYLLAVVACNVLTGLSFTCSFLVPDVFTPITLLGFILLLSDHSGGVRHRVMYALAFGFGLTTQLSSILSFFILLVLAGLWLLVRRKGPLPFPLRRYYIVAAV